MTAIAVMQIGLSRPMSTRLTMPGNDDDVVTLMTREIELSDSAYPGSYDYMYMNDEWMVNR